MGRSEEFNVGKGISNLAKAMEPFNKKYESSEADSQTREKPQIKKE